MNTAQAIKKPLVGKSLSRRYPAPTFVPNTEVARPFSDTLAECAARENVKPAADTQRARETATLHVLPKSIVEPEKPKGLEKIFTWLRKAAPQKRLQLTETVSLGEKRFVALLQVDGRKFLIGGGPTGIALLTQLEGEASLPDLASVPQIASCLSGASL